MTDEIRKLNQELLDFTEESPTAYQAADRIRRELKAAGFRELSEGEVWGALTPGDYLTVRNGSSVIAFRIPEDRPSGFQIIASHSDSPSFKLKTDPEMEWEGRYVRLNVEKYGGMIMAPWFDRPLSVAGRVAVRTENGVRQRLIHLKQDLLMIPNLAIHMNREMNDGVKYNPQKDLLPVIGGAASKGRLRELVAEQAGAAPQDILGEDLFLYNRQKGCIWGAGEEFIASPRLDDLQCVFASLKGFLASRPKKSIAVLAVFDNEEVGSVTGQGAASTFLPDVLKRIAGGLGWSGEEYRASVRNSLLVSADDAHAAHPNYGEKADPVNRPYLNGGIVLKFHAGQKYTSDAMSAAVFRLICGRAGASLQTFHNRSDLRGGSTLGNIAMTQVSMAAVDIGLPLLAMHSPFETGGALDTAELVKVSAEFFSSALWADPEGGFRLLS